MKRIKEIHKIESILRDNKTYIKIKKQLQKNGWQELSHSNEWGIFNKKELEAVILKIGCNEFILHSLYYKEGKNEDKNK